METLIAKYGLEVTMPDLRHLIAQCPRPGAPIHALRRVPDLKSGAARRRSHQNGKRLTAIAIVVLMVGHLAGLMVQ